MQVKGDRGGEKKKAMHRCAWPSFFMAGQTGLEPATSGVTGRHSNRLSYYPMKNNF